ncbi:FGGY-family carbohydrate kinase [Stagnihabitans tardus]|uniref:ATP:glycerol 3-phosphotransferase n=1 Tax=Stagnihabitans tardus TaxID=2699202 RepID=A0AAE4YD49_9RHOB|nr:FGGY family carbohydrate kinase [Stagnihabitans tardus]NBZ87775.1 glycerol kinase [Stagnihabitans tardus]
MTRILAIDQGTTNTKAILVDETGAILARASAPLTTEYPHPGWAEQSAQAIWASVQKVIADLAPHGRPDGIAIANQRETLVVWDRKTGTPLCPAPIWQCRRTAEASAWLIADGHDAKVIAATGLGINPLFPAGKLAWVLENIPEAKPLLSQGRLCAGTVDAWLLFNLTGAFATDHSNASRTQLFDTRSLTFSDDLAALFGASTACLPEPRPSDSRFGQTPEGIPVLAMMGDSHAALYGHGVRAPGTVKATYGTGSSLMTLTPGRVASSHGLSGTIAWTGRHGTAHALEGNITVSAQAVSFMGGILGLGSAAEVSTLAETVPDTGGVVFVPALAGLGAPHWDDQARGTITGMTHGTTRAHLARAAIEAVAHQIADVFAAMEADGGRLEGLRADGGASGNGFLMQRQADFLARPVTQSAVEEVGALGAAAMAFTHFGVTLPLGGEGQTFSPARDPGPDRALWAGALRKARA